MYTTDNRYAPGGSGATVPDDAPAAYSARWIDQGDYTPADVLWDRQGLAYNDTGYRDDLLDALRIAGDSFRTPHAIGLDTRDETIVVMNTPVWKCYMRRAGGYIYVDAWLQPAVPERRSRTYMVTVTAWPTDQSDLPSRDQVEWALTHKGSWLVVGANPGLASVEVEVVS